MTDLAHELHFIHAHKRYNSPRLKNMDNDVTNIVFQCTMSMNQYNTVQNL